MTMVYAQTGDTHATLTIVTRLLSGHRRHPNVVADNGAGYNYFSSSRVIHSKSVTV